MSGNGGNLPAGSRRARQRPRWWILFLGAAVALFGAAAFSRRVAGPEPDVGVVWVQSRSGPVALEVARGSPAERAGILPGDRLVRLNGREVVGALEAGEAPWKLPPGKPLRLEIERGGTSTSLELLPRYRPGRPALYGYLSLVGVAFLASGMFIAHTWPTVRGGLLYSLLSIAAFSQMVLSHTGRADAFDWAVFAGDVVAGAAVPALLLHLAAHVGRRPVGARKLVLAVAYGPSVLLLLYAAWAILLRGVYRLADPVRGIERTDRLELLFLVFAVAVSSVFLARATVGSPSSLHRSQARWMLWGLGAGLGPFALLYAAPWATGAELPPWADLAVLPMLSVPAAFTAALARYRLHDLDLVLRRGIAGVALAFLTFGFYLGSLEVLRRVVEDLALPASVLGFLAALATAVAYSKLRAMVRAGVDRAFYRARYSYRSTLLDWGRQLNAELDLPTLLERLEGRVRETLGVGRARVLVRQHERLFSTVGGESALELAELSGDLLERVGREPCVVVEEGALGTLPWARYLFGMKVKGKLCALLAVSEREAEEGPLSSEDRALLSTLSAHAAAAIEAARLVREVRERAEQVERLKARQERILESSGVGLLLLDSERRILAMNRTLETMYGVRREEAIGRGLRDVFPLQTARVIERELQSAGALEEARVYRHTLVDRRGRRIIVNLSISRESGEPGGDGARVVTFDDITERVKLEEQLLRQERLASLGLLAAGVAHEVNTPLTGILGYTQMLLEELPPDDPRRDTLEKIQAQSLRASSIANSLLDFSRPDDAGFELVSVGELLEETLRLFEPQVRGRGIRFEARLEADLPRVRGHKGKLQQVLLNLLLNARDAVGQGGRIEVAAGVRSGKVVLEVTDDGVGIAEEDLGRIFDPFFTTKGRGRGTGLGLSISYGIVREHEGEIQVESSPGEFTRFRVELPPASAVEAAASGS
jgi:hypothetical protein